MPPDTVYVFLSIVALMASGLTIYAVSVSKGRGKFLCQDCRFNNPNDCLKEIRPEAIACTAYRSKRKRKKSS